MAFKKKPTTSKDVFVLTLPLRCEPWRRDLLDKMFQCCNHIKNALIRKELNALRQMERTKVWKQLQSAIASSYNAEESEEDDGKRCAIQAGRELLFQQKKDLMEACGFSKLKFEKAVKPMQKHYRTVVNSQVAQKITADVWKSFQDYFYGNSTEIHFSKISDFCTIEGKSNSTGILYKDGFVRIGKKLVLPVVRSKNDRFGYEAEALSREVHYCRIMRKPGLQGWVYFVQLILAGNPPQKVDQKTGEVIHSLGEGRVGNDIGPQTLATVSDHSARLEVFCERAQDIQKELRIINRAMDRSRRDTNPEMFNEKGEIVSIDRLPDHCVSVIRGTKRRKWVESKRYKQLVLLRRYLYRKQSDQRRQSHNELANKLLPLGDEHYIETMNWQSLAKRAKKTEISEKTGRYKRKKRFGKSIANKAPGLFMVAYEKKVIAAGGKFYKINTWAAKASQFDHSTKAYKKKHLSTRWHILADGSKVQRDLYSAFLIQNTNETLNGFVQPLLDEKFEQFKAYHDAEIRRLQHVLTPSSTGVRKNA